jgi:S1-C subfamily serine protease
MVIYYKKIICMLGLVVGVVGATPVYALQSALPVNPLRAFGDQVADVVDEVLPSVVVIRTEAVRYHLGQDWFFGHMYRIPERTSGQGSGVIISEDGYVLTSHHVVDKAQQIEVMLDDETMYPAELIGGDPHTDLAVLKIIAEERKTFPAVTFGDSDEVRVGEVVIAIGSPFNLSSTVTMGIVSQKGRVIGMLPYEDFIQTQAPINPGNSGGPLVDADGHMVGINAAIHRSGPQTVGNIGIGFAVPANLAMRVAQAMIQDGHITHPWIGIMMQRVEQGVEVEEVFRNSPAEQAGMARGDIITHVNGRSVFTALDVRRAIFQHALGDNVSIRVLRNDRPMELAIVPEAMPEFDLLQR